MSLSRREIIKITGLGIATGVVGVPAFGAEVASKPKQSTQMKLGTVTYNIAKDWDLETIIENCQRTHFEGVELRTTHAHGVEVNLSPAEREKVKKMFQDSPITLVGLGSAFDYHTPDQDKLRRDIEATKEYMILARDVGTDGVKVRPNGFPDGVSREKTIEQIGQSLRELGEFGEGIGIQIRLEVHGSGTSHLPYIKQMMDVADHKNVGVCWNCNGSDLDGEGFQHNFNLVKDKMFLVHLKELSDTGYPFRQLFANLNEMDYDGFCLAEISGMSNDRDTLRFMNYYRTLWLAYQDLI